MGILWFKWNVRLIPLLSPLCMGKVISIYLKCLRCLGKESTIFSYFLVFSRFTRTELELTPKFRPCVTKSKMLPDWTVKVFQLKCFLLSLVESMEGLNIPKAQNFFRFHSWEISGQPFSVRASQKVRIFQKLQIRLLMFL